MGGKWPRRPSESRVDSIPRSYTEVACESARPSIGADGSLKWARVAAKVAGRLHDDALLRRGIQGLAMMEERARATVGTLPRSNSSPRQQIPWRPQRP